MESEKRRQEADMAARMDARKRERYERQLRLAETAAATALEVKHKEQQAALLSEQEAQRRQLEQDIAREAAAVQPKSSDPSLEGGDIDAELQRMRAAFELDVPVKWRTCVQDCWRKVGL